ncbi:disease resistance protein RPV1-like [Mangifera indica]|uniref:disease resistance protein RPV1-like n=1 Tax=Mangifera indica TaxID=29780 RepID=UPI001CFC364C|nr:disease resistance protein RPV1-like [Mangifera indica]
MASSSSSSSQVKYDVFLSFRGEDTRDNFTSHLNAALCWRKIVTFIGGELVRGDEISPSLLNAIEGSKISIIIFSKGYASSTWCLQELVQILNCKRMFGQIVIPVFYHVNPSNVRKQSGTYGDAFRKHEVRYSKRKEILQIWRNALTEAANLSGFDSNSIRPESKLIETIIEYILERLNDMSSSNNKNLVGVAMKIQKIISLLFNNSNKVCKVGLWGMGGIGKTTLAIAVFNEISSQFEASYFIPNIREASNKHQLHHLQKELLFAILEDAHINIRLTFVKERLGCKRVLIVFDDVTNLKQVRELIGDLENLGYGSRIIITTRDKQVLKNCGLNDSPIYEVEGLGSDESLQLFKQHAFRQNHPIDEVYLKISERVISYTKGLPLALEILGCFLLGREKYEWESALDELKKSPNEVIQTLLKISYDGLSDKEKTLFLDIACFFKGWDKYLVGTLGSHIGVCVLVDKALITISHNTIGMHDLIQEMGWEIIRQEPINKLGQRSQLWHHDDVYSGTDKLRGMLFNMVEMREIHLNPHTFSEMANLRFLIVNNFDLRHDNKVHGFDNIEFDFSELRCLCWDHSPFPSLPLKFDPDNLVVLKMKNNNLEQLWTGIKNLAHLKYIDLSYSKHLLKVPDLSKAQNLECLILEGCTSLFEITTPSRNLNKLVNLNLRNCKSLISLPNGICKSKLLKYLRISGCSKLERLPEDLRNLESLEVLEAIGISVRTIFNYVCLTELPNDIDKLSLLEDLELEGNNFQSIPSNIMNLSKLQILNIRFCNRLQSLPKLPRNIEELRADGCKLLKALSDTFCLFKHENKGAGKPQGVMCFPGSDIPEWFNIQSSGSSIKLPQGLFNKKFLGLVFCVIVEVEDNYNLDNFLNVVYELQVKGVDVYITCDKKLLSLGPMYIKSDHVLLGYNCNSLDNELFELPCDKEAIISFNPKNNLEKFGVGDIMESRVKNIKKCGVRLLFTEEFEEPMKRSRCSIFDEEDPEEECNIHRYV